MYTVIYLLKEKCMYTFLLRKHLSKLFCLDEQEAVKDMETECAIAEVIASNEEGEVGGAEVEEINMDVVSLTTDNILGEEIINPTQCKVGIGHSVHVQLVVYGFHGFLFLFLSLFKVCKEDFLSCDILKIHLRAHLADIPFRCGMCHFVAESRSQLSNHMTTLHQNQLKVGLFKTIIRTLAFSPLIWRNY